MKIRSKTVAVAIACLTAMSSATFAHQTTGDPFPHVHSNGKRSVVGQVYTPAIWVDPDGCEHWVMDDGLEGYMTPKLDRNGRPTCRGGNSAQACGVLSSDTLFATNSYRLNNRARNALRTFFANNPARSYTVAGHTDSRGSDAFNMRLSQNRANSVARYARSVGANVTGTQAYGERQPIASNSSRAGMARNRRVEIMCAN